MNYIKTTWNMVTIMIVACLSVVTISFATFGSQVLAENLKTDQKIIFPDRNLEREIRKKIKKPEGIIYVADLKRLTGFYAPHSSIINLTGLEHCTNLEELYLWGNRITDISALSTLINLEELHLSYTKITDISALSTLTKLEELWLWGNPLNANSTSLISQLR